MSQPELKHAPPRPPKPVDAALFADTLEDAERLLKYAAKIGVPIDAGVRDGLLQARAAFAAGWNDAIAADLLVSLTRLAVSLRPVTAESLKVSDEDSKKTGRSYWIVSIFLGAIIIPYSLASFVTSAISDSIRKDIVTANELAVKLTSQLGSSLAPKAPPGGAAS